jgi:hypothetical protein
MCGHGRHHQGDLGHHGDCGCHEGRHGRHHEGCECGSHQEHACECGCHENRHECECDCHEGGSSEIHFRRQFTTRAERIAQLEQYLTDLQAEAKAVEERIAEMKAVSA